MRSMQSPPTVDTEQPAAVPLMAQGDARWEQRQPEWRERELALPWPRELLETFTLRMSSHGMCVSRSLMLCDRRYALEQLAHAHNLADDTLRMMAVQLFRHFEARQSGIPAFH